MAAAITIEILDKVKADIATSMRGARKAFRGLVYADLRLAVREGQHATAENGQSKQGGRDATVGLGIRVAAGHYGRQLGAGELAKLPEIVREGLGHATARAVANASQKTALKRQIAGLGKSLTNTAFAPIDVRQETVAAQFEIDPRSVPLAEIIRYTTEVSRTLTELNRAIRYNQVTSLTGLNRQLFASSEGALIDQATALTEGGVAVVAEQNGVVQENWDAIGHQRGFEVLLHGVAEDPIHAPNLATF